MKTPKIVVGQRFGRLIIISQRKKRRSRHRHVLVQCDCGKRLIVRAAKIFAGESLSCGCLHDWTPEKAIRRLNRAIQHEINEINKYERESEDWTKVFNWMRQRVEELDNQQHRLGGGDGKFGVIQACPTVQ